MDNDDRSWRQRAACRGTGWDLWFAPPNTPSASSLEQRRVRDASAICLGCPVRQECLDYALEHSIWYGIWGGMTERERRNLAHNERRHHRTAAARNA